MQSPVSDTALMLEMYNTMMHSESRAALFFSSFALCIALHHTVTPCEYHSADHSSLMRCLFAGCQSDFISWRSRRHRACARLRTHWWSSELILKKMIYSLGFKSTRKHKSDCVQKIWGQLKNKLWALIIEWWLFY